MELDELFGHGAYTHNGDKALLESLGLRSDGFGPAWTDLGTATVEEAEPEGQFGPRPAATVGVEVYSAPAMFWRFTVLRPRDESEEVDGEIRGVYEPRERRVITTGSGGFCDYWPTARLVAQNMLDVEEVVE